MIFPIGDTNVKGGSRPIFSYAFIGINIIVFLLQMSVPGNLVCDYAAIPGDIIAGKGYYTLMSSMFMHGGWMHLIGNMLFLWVFADNIEAVIGNSRFVVFYLLGGLFASMLHIGMESWMSSGADMINCCKPCLASMSCPTEVAACQGFVPSLGASGAISAVLGAYLIWFPKSKIKMFAFVTSFTIPAIAFLGFWFLEQMVAGVGSLGVLGAKGGVAWWAHIGGFVFGLAYGWLNKEKVRSMLL